MLLSIFKPSKRLLKHTSLSLKSPIKLELLSAMFLSILKPYVTFKILAFVLKTGGALVLKVFKIKNQRHSEFFGQAIVCLFD